MKILRRTGVTNDQSGWDILISDDEMFNHFVVVSKVMREEMTRWMRIASGEEKLDNT